MSHKQKIDVVVNDREALVGALEEMGFEVNETKTTLKDYDFTINADISVKKNGKQLMIGFIAQEDGSYKLEADFYRTGFNAKEFQDKVNQLHGKHKAANWMANNRYTVTYETNEDGDVVVVGSRWSN